MRVVEFKHDIDDKVANKARAGEIAWVSGLMIGKDGVKQVHLDPATKEGERPQPSYWEREENLEAAV